MSNEKQNEYLVRFRTNEWYNTLSPQELQNVMSQCKEWFERLSASGKIKGGQALAREGTTITGKSGRVVSDGPFAESKEAIGGFFVLEAASLQEATAFARGNPLLAYGMTIDIRPVAETCPLEARARQLAQETQLAAA
jgi:hypothetical protein